jgi:hypothetical protein
MQILRRKAVLVFIGGLIALSARADLSDGLVLHYPFDRNDGGIVKDVSGCGNDGNIVGAQYIANGYSGGAYHFSSDYIRVPDNPSLNLASGMTVCAWIRSEYNGGARTILSQWNDYSWEHSFIFKIHNSSDKLRIELSKGYHNNLADLSGGTSIPIGEWTHVAATYDGSKVRLYVNGKEDSSLSAAGPIAASDMDLIVGGMWFRSNQAAEFFMGDLDDVRVYNRALSGLEVGAVCGMFHPYSGPSVTMMGLGAQEDGPFDVVDYYPDEQLHIVLSDEMLDSASSSVNTFMLLRQRTTGRRRRVQRVRRVLVPQEDGSFRGRVPLDRFQPGPVDIWVYAQDRSSGYKLMRASEIQILDSSEP